MSVKCRICVIVNINILDVPRNVEMDAGFGHWIVKSTEDK